MGIRYDEKNGAIVDIALVRFFYLSEDTSTPILTGVCYENILVS